MTTHTSEQHWVRKARLLTQVLIISITINLGLLAAFIGFALHDKQTSVAFELQPGAQTAVLSPPTNEALLRSYSALSFQELLLLLENKEKMEQGYTKRDLALCALVAFHHFNLERALGGLAIQQRQIAFTDPSGEQRVEVASFPGLADYQYQAIIHYARTEKWPFTSQGLFFELQRQKGVPDPTLLEAFFLTSEFYTVSILFSKSGANVEKEALAELLAQGEWGQLREFTASQRLAQDLSLERRRSFLLSYFNQKSPRAAKILLDTDLDFALKQLDDAQILFLLSTMSEKTTQNEQVAKQLLTSPRSDAVLQKSALLLYAFSGEMPPSPYDHNVVLAKFAPEALPPPPPAPKAPAVTTKKAAAPAKVAPVKASSPKAKALRTHVVQAGDNLWKIARKYRVSIESIKKQNRLDSEKLKVGRKLEIPEK